MIGSLRMTIYYSTRAGRRFLIKRAAIAAEARAIIEAKYPREKSYFDGNGYETEEGWHWRQLERSDVLYRRLCRLIKNTLKEQDA